MSLYKKKIKKQKRRLFISVAASLFALSVIVSSIFAILTYNTEKQLLASNAYTDWYNTLVQSQPSYTIETTFEQEEYFDDYIEYYLNKYHSENEQIILLDDDGAVKKTGNALPVDFSSYPYYQESGTGCIDFENFRASMTDEQYEKICYYLLSEPTDDGKYYELLCTDYYFNKGDIVPITVEIVATEKDNVWYVQDEVIERFELALNVDEKNELYKSGDMQRNVIDKEFVFGNYSREDLIGKVLGKSTELIGQNDTMVYHFDVDDSTDGNAVYYYSQFSTDSERPTTPDDCLFSDDKPFSYIFFNANSFSVRTGTDDVKIYTLYYAQSFNVLENCFNRIAFIFIYIFALFTIVGVILAAVIWHTMKRQIKQEENLRSTTNAMAHDLKTPLFIISGYAENLKENIYTDKREHYADVICRQTNEMNLLIHQMLDFSRLESLNYQLSREKFYLAELTAELLEKYKGINLTQDIMFVCDKAAVLNGDKRLIKCAIENLIDNAIKYSDEKEAICISIKDKKFTISNSCNTISKKEIKKLWQPYCRIDKHNNEKGNGLGLSIVKNIFDLHKFKYGAKYRDGMIIFWFKWK